MANTKKRRYQFHQIHIGTCPADDGILDQQHFDLDPFPVQIHNILRAPFWKRAPVADGWMPFFVDDGSGGEKAIFRRTIAGVTEEILINPWASLWIAPACFRSASRTGGLGVSEIASTQHGKEVAGAY